MPRAAFKNLTSTSLLFSGLQLHWVLCPTKGVHNLSTIKLQKIAAKDPHVPIIILHIQRIQPQEHDNFIIEHLATTTERFYLAPASPRLVIHNQIMHRHPNLMHLLILHVASWI